MSFYFSKSKFVAVCNTCNKYAWLDKNRPDDKEERKQIKEDLIKYCALDTYAVVKVIKKFYEVI